MRDNMFVRSPGDSVARSAEQIGAHRCRENSSLVYADENRGSYYFTTRRNASPVKQFRHDNATRCREESPRSSLSLASPQSLRLS